MLRRHFIAGVASGAALAGLPLAHAQAKPGRWMRLESPHFVYFATGDEQKARNEVAALERYRTLLEGLIPRETRSERKLTVYAAGNVGDLNRIRPGVHADIAGFYNASVEHVSATTAPFRAFERQKDMMRHVRAMDAQVILFHEYAHHFMKANLEKAFPDWYSEGFAEFVSTADFTDEGVWIGKFTNLRGQWLGNGDWLSIDKFFTRKGLNRNQTQMYYAQAWLAVHYMFTHPERARAFDRYAMAISSGDDPVAAFQPAFGITVQEFDKELRDYKREKLSIFQLAEKKVDHASAITVQRLSAAANELLASMAFIRSVPLINQAKDTVAHVRKEAAKFHDDPFAIEALATVELWYGEPAKARELADKLIALNPARAETQHLSGLCDLRAGYANNDIELFKRARGSFAEAHRQDKTMAVSLFRYIECLARIEGGFTQHMLDVALEAHRLDPQVVVIKILAAQGLIQHKRWKEAEVLLSALMMEPHEADSNGRIRTLMEAARAQQATPLIFYASAPSMEHRPE